MERVERTVTLSRFTKPDNYPEDQVWIFVKERERTKDYISAAIRMRPDKLIISSELFGFFQVI